MSTTAILAWRMPSLTLLFLPPGLHLIDKLFLFLFLFLLLWPSS